MTDLTGVVQLKMYYWFVDLAKGADGYTQWVTEDDANRGNAIKLAGREELI